MLIKAGVDISRLNREIRRALPKIQDVLRYYDQELVITSTYEGNHGEGSLHYADDAIDMRKIEARPIDGEDKIKEKLGKDYDVVLERDHIHVEYDPKK
jgi:hypothetical protein